MQKIIGLKVDILEMDIVVTTLNSSKFLQTAVRNLVSNSNWKWRAMGKEQYEILTYTKIFNNIQQSDSKLLNNKNTGTTFNI